MIELTPTTEDDAAAMVREARAARAARRRLRIRGGGTRAGLGRPVEADAVLCAAGLTGITLHEPAELVISARTGTTVAALEAALAAHGQALPFEPVDHRALYGTTGEPTVGGLVATNAARPRRIAVGAVRDHLIGARFVNGFGEVVKSGGRVMKNVTGLDLARLQCGAHGTLGFLTEATFKVLPKPEAAATLVWRGLGDARAVAAMSAALGSPFEIGGAAHLPSGPWSDEPRTLLRLEGFATSVDARCDRLASALAAFGRPERMPETAAAALWKDVGDGGLLARPAETAIWRVSLPPTRGPALAGAFRQKGVVSAHSYDWGGGLVLVALPAEDDACAAHLRSALAGCGGHATLVRAPAELRTRVDVFEPPGPALLAIAAGIKKSLDPGRILNPGAMYGGV